MRSLYWVVIGVAVSGSARAQPAPVDADIEKQMTIARSLARDGHCDIALDYGKDIEAKAPSYYTQVFLADPYIIACTAGTAPKPQRPATSAPVPTTDENIESVFACRRARIYLEPSLFHMSGSPWVDGTGG